MKRAIFLVLFGVAGCWIGPVDPHKPLSADFGNSVGTDIAAQVVNPTPVSGLAETDGVRIGNAMRRYYTNRVYVPQPLGGTALETTTPAAPAATAPTAPMQ